MGLDPRTLLPSIPDPLGEILEGFDSPSGSYQIDHRVPQDYTQVGGYHT